MDKTAEFYERVFGLAPIGKSRSKDRARNRLSDGTIDLTFFKYDDGNSAMAERRAMGRSLAARNPASVSARRERWLSRAF